MFASVTGRIARKSIGGATAPLFICERCEISPSDELQSLSFLSTAHVSIYSPEQTIGEREARRYSERRAKFFSSMEALGKSGVEICHSTPNLFVQIYLSARDCDALIPDLDRGLESNYLLLHISLDFPFEGQADAWGHQFTLADLKAGEPVYSIGLPSMQLVQPSVP